MELQTIVQDDNEWDVMNTGDRKRIKGRMNCTEHLIHQYKLYDWINPNYYADSYAGLLRRGIMCCDVTE